MPVKFSISRQRNKVSNAANRRFACFVLPVLFFYKLPSDNMIKVDKELCKGCNICTEFCPFKVYEQSKKPNKKGVRLPTPEHEERCTKCGLCALMCPDQAIRVEEKEE